MRILNWEAILWDCLIEMRNIPDCSIDMILTDPPYWMDLTPQRINWKFHWVKIENDNNLSWSNEFFSQSFRVLKKNTVMYCFCSHHSIWTFISSAKISWFIVKNLLIWDKDWFGMWNNWRPNFEMILVLWNWRFVTKSKNKSNLLKYRRISPQKSLHPTEKVIPLLEELITEPDYNPKIILDPFAWSFTTAVAAENTNRKWICIEKDEWYYNIGINRLNNSLTALIKK